MCGAIAGGIASALAGGAMSKLLGGGQKAASGGIQGDVLATDNNTVGMGDAGIKSAIQGSNVPTPDGAVPSFVSGAMAKAGKGLLDGPLRAGASDVSETLLVLAGFENEKEFAKIRPEYQKEIAEMQNESLKEVSGSQSANFRQNTKD